MPTRALAIVAVLGAIAASCATVQRDTFIHEQAGTYVYDQPLQTVWPAARQVLKDAGYSFRESAGIYAITTEWKEEMANSNIASEATRYLVEGKELDSDHCVIRFFRNSATAGGGPGVVEEPRNIAAARAYANPAQGGRGASTASGTRDLKLEWQVLQKAAPGDAKDLEEEARLRFP